MPIVFFTGRILPPDVVKLSVRDLDSVHWEEAPIGLVMDFKVSIDNSMISVECQLNRYGEEDLPYLHVRAFDLAQTVVSIFAFANGWGLTIWLDTFVDPIGVEKKLFSQLPSLAPLSTAFDLKAGAGMQDAWHLAVKEPALFMALNDLILAITIPHVAPVNCARVIDGILRMMIPPGSNPEKGWPLMHQNLNVDKAYLQFITDQSKGPRHGDRTFIPGSQVTPAVERTWNVMNRFLEFRKSGHQALPPTTFELLTG